MDTTEYREWNEGLLKRHAGTCRCWGQRLLGLALVLVASTIAWILVLTILSSRASSERGTLLSRQDLQVTNASKLTALLDDLKKEVKAYNSSCVSMQVQLQTAYAELQKAQGKLMEQESGLMTQSLAEAGRDRENIRTELLRAVEGVRQANGSCQPCPASWLPFQGSCYFFSQRAAQWEAALRHCVQQGAHLVIVKDLEEQIFLTRNNGNFGYWLGLRAQRRGHVVQSYQWVDGVQLTFSHWNRGEPNDSMGREDCVMMIPTGLWNDAPCDNERDRWICEKRRAC
ncbi:C-type lectin domain family 4 member G isoform X2 [Sorex fumeus]|uniref:C-type lectin domain family 4 member G isoform X2 n=1 Tax=Sorex fumeus TaxID=62283 RepID=UPI0024AD4097|nr:C-type lectin domain family 4 member G isoform X2 [Sorex fumeus]